MAGSFEQRLGNIEELLIIIIIIIYGGGRFPGTDLLETVRPPTLPVLKL